MAEGAITAVLERIFPLLEEELRALSGVSMEVRYIRGELQYMQAFLRVAEARDEIEESVQICAKQVRDVAYDTEDILEEFMLHLAQDDHRDGRLGRVRKMIAKLRARHHIGSSITDIKRRIQDISEGSQRYHFSSLEQGLTRSITERPPWLDHREDALLVEEAELVGFEKPIEDLIGLLLDGESQCRVISVAGMGGLGKTTPVKKVYDHQRVKRQFQSHAWINVSQSVKIEKLVSQSFKIEKLLKDLVQQLFNESKQPIPQDLDTKTNIGLKEMIKQFLQQKRYVIVFDDIWSTGAWDDFENALPKNNCCSRVLVTTRSHDIASSCKLSFGVGHVYNPKPLDSGKSWTLFCKKVFGGNTCPPHLKQLSDSILERCQGLPLAIVAVGGLLAKGSTRIDDWDIINRSLGAELNKNDKLKSMMKILSLSYYHLPYHLKHCFLYLGLFHENYMFKPMTLIRFWIAEGFIEEQAGRTMEEVGESYLNELISRSLIQVAKINIEGRIKRCRVHDLIREIIISKSKDQNFGTETNEWKTSHAERIRRLSVLKSWEDDIPPTKCLSGLRSLMFMKVHKPFNTKFIGGLKLLKVLDLRSVPLEVFPTEFTNLFHLRYLCLRRSKITMLPNSIGRLHNLETLDIKHACISELPMGIFKLQKLRHLLIYSYNKQPYPTFGATQGVKVGREVGNLTCLQKLCIIEPKEQCNDGGDMIKQLGRLSQLNRLGIRKLRREDGRDLCCSIEKMTKLRSLTLTSIDEEALDLESLCSPPPFLQRLYLKGRLEKLPHWIPLLENLSRLKIRWSSLRNDPLEVLGTLPNLVTLGLAGDAESLCFKTRGFQRLKWLRLDKLNGLKSVTMEKGTMPVLEELTISRCELLEKLPFGIEELLNLNVLWFYDMPDEFLARLYPDEGEDHSKISHIPHVRFKFWRNGNWENYHL